MRENMDIDGSLSICEDTRVKRILQSVETGLRSWYSIVNTFGLNENDKVKWEEELQDEIEACVNDCHAAAIEKQQALIDKIESLLTESEKMCKKLTIQMPSFAPTNQGLYNDEKYLIELVKGWQEEITTRTVEIDNLKTRRDEVSKSLGREPFFVKESPLPSRDEIEMYKIKLQELEVEKQHRIEKFRDLQERIIALSDEIKFMPKLDFERDIITGDNLLFFEASDENMQRVEQFHFDLLEMREKIEQELNKLREALEHLWKVLEEDVKYCNDFIQTHVGLNYKTLEAFKTEVKRCELIRKTNLGKFIVKLRTELIDRWNEAGFSEARRAEFAIYMEDDMFTEDLLTLHDMQIERVKAYLRNNQEIFELLKQRDVLYKRMRDLDERANAPDRFKNRGGQLLKEEKERKAVTKKIPCIEEQLLNLAVQYEEKHGEKFTYFDDTIESLIERSREVLEQEKKEQMSARKQKRDVTMSSSKMTPRVLYKSPSMAQLSTRNHLTPHNLRTPMRTPKTAPARRVLTARRSITKAKIRLSTDKKKRIAAMREQIKSSKRTEPNENDIEYSKFEIEMSRKDGAARSTISLQSPHATLLKPSIRIETPRTVDKQLKTFGVKAKLHF